uniref:Uncharacterized protein n=1 Tax=Cacopsylla melanoneura TaxID=428564 RepID=A0A8D8WDP1_9HEMI
MFLFYFNICLSSSSKDRKGSMPMANSLVMSEFKFGNDSISLSLFSPEKNRFSRTFLAPRSDKCILQFDELFFQNIKVNMLTLMIQTDSRYAFLFLCLRSLKSTTSSF